MSNQSNIERLALSGKSIFTINDLAIIWRVSDRDKLKERIKYYLRSKRLSSIHKGVYSYGGDSGSTLEIAQKLVPMSYISLYTAAQINGLIFQDYSTIFSMSLSSKKYDIKNQQYIYHRIKEEVFYNTLGLVNNGQYTIANKERTICDLLYVFPNSSFDNLRNIDTELLKEISRIYENKRLEKEVSQLVQDMETKE